MKARLRVLELPLQPADDEGYRVPFMFVLDRFSDPVSMEQAHHMRESLAVESFGAVGALVFSGELEIET